MLVVRNIVGITGENRLSLPFLCECKIALFGVSGREDIEDGGILFMGKFGCLGSQSDGSRAIPNLRINCGSIDPSGSRSAIRITWRSTGGLEKSADCRAFLSQSTQCVRLENLEFGEIPSISVSVVGSNSRIDCINDILGTVQIGGGRRPGGVQPPAIGVLLDRLSRKFVGILPHRVREVGTQCARLRLLVRRKLVTRRK